MLTPVDPSTAPAPQATFGEQCRTVWRNIADTLEAAGMEVEDLVKVTTYLADRRDADENGAIRREVLGDHHPALTVVLAGIFDESWLLEIEAVAASPVTGSQAVG